MNKSTLKVTPVTFAEMLPELIKSGVVFTSEENEYGSIVITFTGGY